MTTDPVALDAAADYRHWQATEAAPTTPSREELAADEHFGMTSLGDALADWWAEVEQRANHFEQHHTVEKESA